MALWPDADVRARFDGLARQCLLQHPQARRMQAENLHLTLAFIGALAPAPARAVAAMLDELPLACGQWMLDRLGYFAQARVLWAGGTPPQALRDLAQGVRSGLDALQVDFDRGTFVPHVTLLRNVKNRVAPAWLEAQLADAIGWNLGKPALVRSGRDAAGRVRYRPWLFPDQPSCQPETGLPVKTAN